MRRLNVGSAEQPTGALIDVTVLQVCAGGRGRDGDQQRRQGDPWEARASCRETWDQRCSGGDGSSCWVAAGTEAI